MFAYFIFNVYTSANKLNISLMYLMSLEYSLIRYSTYICCCHFVYAIVDNNMLFLYSKV